MDDGGTTNSVHQLVLGSILIADACVLFLYGLLRRNAGFKLRKIGVAITGTGAILMIAPVVVSSPQSPYWVQSLMVVFRAIPFEFLVAYSCYLALQSVGPKYPRWIGTLLGTYWWTLPIVIAFSVAVAILWPLDALQNYSAVDDPAHVMLFKVRQFWDTFYFSLVTVVLTSEAVTQRVPNRLRRIQYGVLAASSVAWLLLCIDNIFGTILEVIPAPQESLEPLVSVQLQLQNWFLVVAASCITVGLILRDAGKLHQELVSMSLLWIKDSNELNIDLDFWFSDVEDKEIMRRLRRGMERRELDRLEAENAKYMVKIAMLLYIRPDRRELLDRIYRNQHELAQHASLTGGLLMGIRAGTRHSVTADPLYESIGPTLRILEGNEQASVLDNSPEWVQFAARALDDIENVLPESLAGEFAKGNGITQEVYAAYAAV